MEELIQEESAQSAENRQFVTFLVGKEVFAVQMAPVREIIRPPEVMAVPLSPRSLEGLANLRGRVLPVISLRDIFGFQEREKDDATRVLVIDYGCPMGFVVDRVASVLTVETEQIENTQSIQSAVNTEFLQGVIKNVGGHAMVMILDFSALIQREFSELNKMQNLSGQGRSHDGETLKEVSTLNVDNDELQLVSFVVADQEYAISIEQVQEIVQVPEQIMQVPNSRAHVLGVMTLRNRLLPLVSLRRMFNLPVRELDEHNRIVVVSLEEGVSVGVVMDTVSEVLRVSRSKVDDIPVLLARTQEAQDITAICRLDNGKRLVSILSAERMFSHRLVRDALKTVEEFGEGESVEEEETMIGMDDDQQMVVFRLAHEEFGVPIESVQEIVRVPEELTRVPKSPAFIEGVINLRGTILPVVDQRSRFDLPHIERNDRQRIMVFLIQGVRTGFIVDSVSEVLKIPNAAIEPSPRLSSEQAKIIHQVANLEKQNRMILLLDVESLLDSEETQALNLVR